MTSEQDMMATEEVVDLAPVRTLAALFDNALDAPGIGDDLPPLWHWVALSRWPAALETGSDGHPFRGSFMPDVRQPRRMFAGGSVEFHGPVEIGTVVRSEIEVKSVTEKRGRSGDFTLVVVESRILNARGDLAIVESQDIVYREAAMPRAAASIPAPPVAPMVGSVLSQIADWLWGFETDPTKLMRFSCATSNGHRIHYDWPYATGTEGYPGLVVQGPLMTLAMTEVLRLQTGAASIRSLTHRNLKPLFCGQPAQVRGTKQSATTWTLTLARGDQPEQPNVIVQVQLGTR